MKKYLALVAVAAVSAFGIGCQTEEIEEPSGAERETMESQTTTNQQSGAESGTIESGSQSDTGTSSDTGSGTSGTRGTNP